MMSYLSFEVYGGVLQSAGKLEKIRCNVGLVFTKLQKFSDYKLYLREKMIKWRVQAYLESFGDLFLVLILDPFDAY